MKYSFRELVDLDRIEVLTDSLCDALGIASSISEPDGTPLVSSGNKRFCLDFHQVNPESKKACDLSHITLINGVLRGEKHVIDNCNNGLWNAVAPIKVEGEHVANFYIGQFLFEPPDREYFREQAAQYGYDEGYYLNALTEIPVVSRDYIVRLLDFVTAFAGVIAELGLRYIKLFYFEKAKHMEVIESLRKSEKRFHRIMESLDVINITKPGQTEEEREILQKRLEESLAKAPEGFLFICAACKRVRDDQGNWQPIERYISDHTGVEFSHGLCPECREKLYPSPK